MDDDKLKINLDLAGCRLPSIVIRREDEYYYRQAAKAIPRILARYRETYKDLSDKEHYYMAMLHFAANMFYQMDRNDTAPFTDEMTAASDLISQRLNGK